MIHSIKRSDQRTIVHFQQPMHVFSWAPFNGGFVSGIYHIINRQVGKDELALMGDIKNSLTQEIKNLNMVPENTVALLTAVNQKFLGIGIAHDQRPHGLTITTLATVGLGNALAPGDKALYSEELETTTLQPTGTINLIVIVNRGLTESARTELVATITLAKAQAMYKLQKPSPISNEICLATGTDCIAICWPLKHPIQLRYAGLHTKLAEVTANSVTMAINQSLKYRQQTAPLHSRNNCT